MKKIILPLLISTLYLIATAQPSKVAFVSTFESLAALQSSGDDDEIAAANWLVNTYGGVFIPVSQIKNNTVNLSEYKALWIHFDRQSDETTINNEFVASFLDNTVKNAINTFYKAGGNLLLSTYATRYVTDLGRYDLPIELKGFGNGGDNGDVWFASPTWGTYSGAPAVFNKITDPIYNGLIGITYVNRDNGSSYPIIPLIGVGWKEDHNYFWNPQPDKPDNKDVWKYRDFENNWSANSLATWTHVQDYFGTAITRWLPRGDFQGKAITIGIGAYEWNQNSGTNPYQSNIERLTKNALDELAPETKMSDYFQTSSSGNWNDINTWKSSTNGTKWYPATLSPTSSAASISILNGHEVIVNNNATASMLNINPSGKLTLNKNITLDIARDFTIESSTAGTGTFVDLNTTGGITVSGNTNVQQYLTSGRNWYVSSPVTGATTAALSTGTSVVSYDELHGTSAPWVTESGILTPMKGYISTAITANAVITFSGTLNTGSQSIALTRTVGQTKEGFNLVGNPYPSHLIWTGAIATAANTLSTIWYRTNVSSVYTFHTYNATGEIGSPAEVTGVIPPMQAFWVRANVGGGTLSFNNAMRLHSSSSNLLKAPSKTKVAQPTLRLQVTNGINSDETVLYFNSNASDDYDVYDSPKMTNVNTAIPEIYTIAGTEKLVINGLNSVTTNEELALGFTTGESNLFTIKATQLSNFEGNIKVYLKDNLLNLQQELVEGTEYKFSSEIASSSSRFNIIFKSVGVTTRLNNASGDQVVLIYNNASNQITVNCKGDISKDAIVSVYSALGQKLQTKQISEANTILSPAFTSGVYVVTVNNAGNITTKKVILN